MSAMTLPDGTVLDLFGTGGGASVAASLSRATGTAVPLLGTIPLQASLRAAGDAGIPLVLSDPGSAAARALTEVADDLAARHRPLVGVSLGIAPSRR